MWCVCCATNNFAGEKDLERRLYREQQRHNDAVNSMISLRENYDDCVAFIQSIPKDLRKQLVERHEDLREVEQQRLDEAMKLQT